MVYNVRFARVHRFPSGCVYAIVGYVVIWYVVFFFLAWYVLVKCVPFRCVTSRYTIPTQVRRLNITVDILVNAAGVCRAGRVDDTDAEGLREQLELNVVGTSLLSRLFAKGQIFRYPYTK